MKTKTCPMCGSEPHDHKVLGQLGWLLWLRCALCGMDFSVKVRRPSRGRNALVKAFSAGHEPA